MIDELIKKWESEYLAMKDINHDKAKYCLMILEDLDRIKKLSAQTINLFGEAE